MPSTGPVATATEITVTNPADGRIVGRVPDTPPAEVARIVADLRAEQPAWEAIGPAGRAVWLQRLRDWCLDNAERITEVIRSETAKPEAEAGFEGPALCDMLNYHAKHAERFLADKRPRPHNLLTATKRLTTTFRPYPVVGIISPWNFPFTMPGMDAVPALAAGAAAVLKPSEVTPLSALELVRGWAEIGAPPVLACVTGAGETGAAVVDHVDFVQFTGSTRTGRAVARRAGERLIPASLELGGKDAAIVLADADLDRAVNGIAWGALMNSGQVCVSIERVYVEAPVYEEFVARLVEHVRSLRQGVDEGDFAADIGALATEAQVRIVEEHVDGAVAGGAKALTGGRRTGTGTFFEPTVLVDVDHSMACMRDETFGPTIPVMKVADADDAVRLVNDSPYGLSATVWTRDRRRGETLARRLEAGAVNVNDVLTNLFCQPLPHGGWKQSGLGSRFGGAAGVRKYCRQQVITASLVPTPRRELLWYPYTARRGRLAARLLRAVVARDARRRTGLQLAGRTPRREGEPCP
ncbi:MAG: aldehyde dehydrogenase family protein [Actinomycetota bacterium]|jgi:acyl-CoA reductase-like NAD-dependent aldehyde dehydrogenase